MIREKGMVAVVNQPSKSIQKKVMLYITRLEQNDVCDPLHHQSRPEIETETFRGDPLEYHYFISVFIGVSLLFLDHPVISRQLPLKLATHKKTSSLVSASFKMVFLFQNRSY